MSAPPPARKKNLVSFTQKASCDYYVKLPESSASFGTGTKNKQMTKLQVSKNYFSFHRSDPMVFLFVAHQ